MLSLVITVAGMLLATAMLLNLWRLIRGPDLTDRVLALDTLYINATAAIVLYGIAIGNKHFLETAMIIAMLGFVGTVAFCKYMLRGDIIE